MLGIDGAGAGAVAATLGQDGLFLADRDGELLGTDPTVLERVEELLTRRPCAVFGCWRGGGLLAQAPAALPPALQAERAADVRLFGWPPERVAAPDGAERERVAAACLEWVRAAITARQATAAWLWCAYRERGRPLAAEPAVVVAGAIDHAWLVEVAGGCNQQHVHWAGEGDAVVRPAMAERDAEGRVVGYRTIAGSPPRVRLLVMPGVPRPVGLPRPTGQAALPAAGGEEAEEEGEARQELGELERGLVVHGGSMGPHGHLSISTRVTTDPTSGRATSSCRPACPCPRSPPAGPVAAGRSGSIRPGRPDP